MKSTTERGYGAEHQTERAKYAKRMKQGERFQCACQHTECTRHEGRCPVTLTHGDRWDLGHNDERTAWTGPECVPCNRGDGARNSNRGADFEQDW